MLTVKQAAEKWGVTTRRVQMLCKSGGIKGATLWERTWMIPDDAVMPKKNADTSATSELNMPMPRKSPCLHMTDLYGTPGTADKVIEELGGNREAQALFSSFISYLRGDTDTAYEHAKMFLGSHSGPYAVLGGGLLLAACAVWRGDIDMWNSAKRHIFEMPCNSDTDRDIVSLTIAAADVGVCEISEIPEWFTRGCFDILPADSHPASKVYYIKYLTMTAFAVASKQLELEGIRGLALMRMLPNTIEPMITQARTDKTVVPEIYLRLSCAVAYHNSGDDKHAIEHIDKAIELALPDRLYAIFMEYIRTLDGILLDRVELADPDAAARMKEMYKKYIVNWSKISGIVRNRTVAANLTVREREVAKLSAFGFTVKEISARLYISESTVKQTMFNVIQKTGINDRSEFASIL